MRKEKTDDHWKYWVEAWHTFVIDRTSMPPAITGKDCKALKNLKAYFLRCVNPKTQKKHTEEEALFCFQFILKNWDKIDKFRQQYNLMFIYSHLSDYIADLKKGGGKMHAVETNTKSIQEKGFEYYKNL
jgi:hypothetical protein